MVKLNEKYANGVLECIYVYVCECTIRSLALYVNNKFLVDCYHTLRPNEQLSIVIISLADTAVVATAAAGYSYQ